MIGEKATENRGEKQKSNETAQKELQNYDAVLSGTNVTMLHRHPLPPLSRQKDHVRGRRRVCYTAHRTANCKMAYTDFDKLKFTACRKYHNICTRF